MDEEIWRVSLTCYSYLNIPRLSPLHGINIHKDSYQRRGAQWEGEWGRAICGCCCVQGVMGGTTLTLSSISLTHGQSPWSPV